MAIVKNKIEDDSLSKFKNKFSATTKYKPLDYFECGEAFEEASGIPGFAIGHINQCLGHSDTGKTTALIAGAKSATDKGYLPVFLITEQKWDFSHAKLMGFPCEEDGDGEWDGPFIFTDGYSYIEQVTDTINSMLDEQDKGNFPKGFKGYAFFWDSVGSIPCKMTFEGKGGKQHTAGVLAEKIGMGINQRICSSRKENKPFTNTLIIINQPWVELPDNPMGQPKIKAKGGEAVYLNATLVFRFGNEKNAGIQKIDATKGGRKINIITKSKITVMKNHINGLGYKDSAIYVTPHGYIPATDEAKKTYVAEHMEYLAAKLGGTDFDIVEENDMASVMSKINKLNANKKDS